MSAHSELNRLADIYAELIDSEDRDSELEARDLFQDAARVDVVQGLIAENERIKARLCVCRDCAGRGEVYSGHDSYQGHFQPPEPDMDICGTCGGDGVLGPLEDFEALAAERDQLKATIAQQAQMIEHLRGGPIPCYTTSDIANADADGFKNGRKSVGLLLGKGFNTLEQAGGKYSIKLAFQNADDAYSAYTEIATIVRLAGEA